MRKLVSLIIDRSAIHSFIHSSIAMSKKIYRAKKPDPVDPVTITAEERVTLTFKPDGGLQTFDLWGCLSLHLFNEQDGFVQIKVETCGDPRIQYEVNPFSMDKELFSRENILLLTEKHQPWPTNFCSMILRWKMQTTDDSLVPLSIRCLPSVSANETYVNVQYEASPVFEPLQDVVISIGIPAFQEVHDVQNTDGSWRYDFKKRILEWSITQVGDGNCSGSLAFSIPAVTDTSEFFPISVQFMSTRTFSDVKVVDVLPLRGGDSLEFSQIKLPTTFIESYQVV